MKHIPLTLTCAALLSASASAAAAQPLPSWLGIWNGQNASGTQLALSVTSRSGEWRGIVNYTESKDVAPVRLSGTGQLAGEGRLVFNLGRSGRSDYLLECQRPSKEAMLCDLTVTTGEGRLSSERVRRLNMQPAR